MIKYRPTTLLFLLLSYALLGVIPSQGAKGNIGNFNQYWRKSPTKLMYIGEGDFEKAVQVLNRELILICGYIDELCGNIPYDKYILNLIFYKIKSLPSHLDLTEATNLNGFNKIEPMIINSFTILSLSSLDNNNIHFCEELRNIRRLNIKGMISLKEIEWIEKIICKKLETLFIDLSESEESESMKEYLNTSIEWEEFNEKKKNIIKKIKLPESPEDSYLNESTKLKNQGWTIISQKKGREISNLILKKFRNSISNKLKNKFIRKINNLIEEGADVSIEKNNGKTPLHYAIKKGSKKLATLLIVKGADVNEKDNGRSNLLCYAIKEGNIEMATLFIKHGAIVNVEYEYGNSPLFYAIRKGSKKLATLLIEKGADVNKKYEKGKSLLHLLSSSRFYSDGRYHLSNEKKIEMATLLLENKAKVNARETNGYSPLYYALKCRYIKKATLFIEHGADVNAKYEKEKSLLHLLFDFENLYDLESLAMATLLIKNKADVNAEDKDGYNPLHYALQEGHIRKEGRIKIATLFIKHGAEVNKKYKDGKSLLHLLFDFKILDNRERLEIATLLIRHGAEVNAQNRDGYTPLDLARQKNNLAMINLLIANSVTNNNKNTSLIENDANVNKKNNNTPSYSDYENNHSEINTSLAGNDSEVSRSTSLIAKQ